MTYTIVDFQVRSTDEVLNNLSVEVHQNTSITHCLRCFFSTETISAENKVLCENCCSLQEHQVSGIKYRSKRSITAVEVKTIILFTCIALFYHRYCVFLWTEENAREEAADHPSPAPQAVSVPWSVQPHPQALTPSRLPTRAQSLWYCKSLLRFPLCPVVSIFSPSCVCILGLHMLGILLEVQP